MGLERENRPQTPGEQHKTWTTERAAHHLSETEMASDWLLARIPGLATPGGFACGLAIAALKGLRRERPELRGRELLTTVIAYRDKRLRAIDAEDLIVPVPVGASA